MLSLAVAAGVFSLALTHSLAQPAPDAGKGEIKLDASEITLDNGLRVIVVNRPGVPVVSTYVWYAVGSADEEPQKTGIAHFLEHMMFKGSSKYKKGDIDSVTSRNGGSNNAFTSNDYTAYFIDLPKSRYAEALKIESDRMRHLGLDLKEFESEKKVVQSETDISADNPQSQLWERLDGYLYGSFHPYAHPVLGWRQDVEDTTRRDMRAFYERNYHPNHATLVMCGDITLEEAKPVIVDLFGNLPKGPELKRPAPVTSNFKGPRSYEVKGDTDVVQLVRGYPGVQAGHADEPALDVMGMILGDGVTSRLYTKLVDEGLLANQIAAGNSTQMLGGSFYIWAELADEIQRTQLVDGISNVINALMQEGVSDAELERAKRRVVAADLFGRESSSNIAQELGQAQVVLGDWRAALRYPNRIKSVTVADVQRVARQYLGSGNCVNGWLVPELSPDNSGGGISDAKPQPLPVERHVLDNGLVVLLYARPGLPVLSINASVRAGRATEPKGKSGISNFAGSLLDAGTTSRTKLAIAETIEGVGGELSLGSSGGSLRVLTEYSALGLDLLSDCMLNPAFVPVEIELLRKQLLANIEAAKDETAGFARDAASAWVYGPATPLGEPSLGTVASIKGISRDDLANWHRTWFRPDNAIIAAVGDFKSGELLTLIKARFGAWKKPAEALAHAKFEFKRNSGMSGAQRVNFAEFDSSKVDTGKKRIAIDHPEKEQVVVRLQGLGIKRDNPDYIPLLVMENILGTSVGFTDRFSKRLRDDMGLAYSTYANITAGAGLYEGSFLGYIGTRPENVELALKTMYSMLEEIRTLPVSDRELRDSKDYLKGSFVFGLETTGQLADLMVSIERFGLGNDYLVKHAQNIEAVTKEDILRVASKYLVADNMVEVLCGPIEKVTPAPTPGEGK